MIKVTENKVELREIIAEGMLEKKAFDVIIMDLRQLKESVVDYFVICSANSDTQVDAVAESVKDEVYKATKQLPWHSEGKKNKEWILLDYVNVVAHIFKKDKRDFYALEELWGDAKIVNIDNI